MRGLLNVVEDYNWESQGDGKIKIYLNVISLLAAATQVEELCNFINRDLLASVDYYFYFMLFLLPFPPFFFLVKPQTLKGWF